MNYNATIIELKDVWSNKYINFLFVSFSKSRVMILFSIYLVVYSVGDLPPSSQQSNSVIVPLYVKLFFVFLVVTLRSVLNYVLGYSLLLMD